MVLQLDNKKYRTGIDANHSPLFNILTAEFNAFVSLRCQIVHAINMKLLCPPTTELSPFFG